MRKNPLNTILSTAGARRVFSVVPFLLALGIASCDADPVLFPPPAGMEITRLPPPSGAAGEDIGRAPQVLVRDASGSPRPGIRVQFEVVQGGGTITPTEVISDERGIANASRWVLGTAPGPQAVEARIENLPPQRFQATAVPGAPTSFELIDLSGGQVTVGTVLNRKIGLEFRDRFENPVPDVPVSAQIIVGDGSILATSNRSGADGVWFLQRWTMGTAPGEEGIRLTYGFGIQATREIRIQTVTAPPAAIVLLAGAGQVAAPGQEVDFPPAVRVEDPYRNPVTDVPVSFVVVKGGGSVSDGSILSNASGIAALQSWRLGPEPGVNELEVRVEGVAPLSVVAEAEAGELRLMTLVTPPAAVGAAGYPLPTVPEVRVTREDGTPVAGALVRFEILEGGGSISPTSTLTNSAGVARVEGWRLGSVPGGNRLLVRVSGASGLTLQANGELRLALTVDRVQINQGNQTAAGDIPGVANRAGVIRAIGRANMQNTAAPRARITLFLRGSAVLSEVVSMAAPGVPIETDGLNPNITWNLPVSADVMQPGLSVRVEIDPAGEVEVPDRSELIFPAPAEAHPLDVRELPPFRVTFIPVNSTQLNSTGRINASNVDQFMDQTLRMFPIGQVDVQIRATLITDEGPMTGGDAQSGWSKILSQIQALRVVEAPDRYYHGILHRVVSAGPAGLGYVPQSPNSAFRSALSHDELAGASFTVAHEFGHNLGRSHAPCGNPSGVDIFFPYATATLGALGYDFRDNRFVAPNDARDLMAYCAPRWISDYTFAGVRNFREASPIGAPGLAASSGPLSGPRHGILLWGEWDSGGATLNPAFRAETLPSVVPARADAQVIGLDEAGGEIFRVGVEGSALDHAADPSLRQFAHFLPISPAQDALLHEIVLVTPFGEARLTRETGEPGPSQAPSLAPGDVSSRAELRWDGARYPMAIIRDESGLIRAFASGGSIQLPEGIGREWEIQMSDGVQVRTERVR